MAFNIMGSKMQSTLTAQNKQRVNGIDICIADFLDIVLIFWLNHVNNVTVSKSKTNGTCSKRLFTIGMYKC
jgi:hypothetical protein